jgi:hypothetical protein
MTLTLGFAAAAQAQAPLVDAESSTPSRPLTADTTVIGRCLCAGESLSAQKQDVDVLGHQFVAAKAHAEATRSAVARARPQVRPDDAEQLDAYRRLLVESQRAETRLYGNTQPAYGAAVTRYNAAVAAYNDGCAGIRVDKAAQARVAQTLVCPAP